MSLNDLAQLRKDTCNPQECDGGVYVGLKHIDSGSFYLSRHGKPSEVRSSKARFYPGDVLYGKLRPYLDKAVVADREGICSTDILVLEPKNVPAWFLCGVLHADRLIDHAKQTTHGVNHPRTSWSGMKVFEATAFTHPEQRKIAAILLKLQNAISIQDKIIQSLTDLKKSTMQHLFTYGLKGEKTKMTEVGEIPESWDVVCLEEIMSDSLYGLSVRGKKKGQYPILRMNCQKNGRVVFHDLQYIDLDNDKYDKFRLSDGDILFNRTNSHELVGRTAIYHESRDAVFASYLIRLRFDSEWVNPDFINNYLNMDSTQKRVRGLASKGVSQSNISASKLKNFIVPIPRSIREQNDISGTIRTIEIQKETQEKGKSGLQSLFKTTLNRLINGEIRVADLDVDVEQLKV